MTKLFSRVFASLPDDVKLDKQLSEKMALIQQFIQPENLDIKPTFMDETLLLVSVRLCVCIDLYLDHLHQCTFRTVQTGIHVGWICSFVNQHYYNISFRCGLFPPMCLFLLF